jgi:hypothetical protein
LLGPLHLAERRDFILSLTLFPVFPQREEDFFPTGKVLREGEAGLRKSRVAATRSVAMAHDGTMIAAQ